MTKKINYILLFENYFDEFYVFENVDELFNFIEGLYSIPSSFQILERTRKKNNFRLLSKYEKRLILECLKLQNNF